MKCIIEGCNREQRSRGLCRSCYQTAWMYVTSGKATWPQLINAGWALVAKSCRPGTAPFSTTFKKGLMTKETRDAFYGKPEAVTQQVSLREQLEQEKAQDVNPNYTPWNKGENQ